MEMPYEDFYIEGKKKKRTSPIQKLWLLDYVHLYQTYASSLLDYLVALFRAVSITAARK